MVDMVKKLHKKSSGLLNPEEEILGATVIMPVGSFKKTVAFGAVGGVVGMAVGQAIGGKGEEAEAGTMADAFPKLKQAILAYSLNLRDRPVAELDVHLVGELALLQFDAHDLVAQVEAVKGARPDRLIEAVVAS